MLLSGSYGAIWVLHPWPSSGPVTQSWFQGDRENLDHGFHTFIFLKQDNSLEFLENRNYTHPTLASLFLHSAF